MKRRELISFAICLLAFSNPCYSSLIGNNVNIDIRFNIEFLGLGFDQHQHLEVLIGEDYDAIVTMPATTVSFVPGGEVDIPDRTYGFDLTNNSILIEAINPTVFFGSLAFEFSSFESLTGAGITISNAVIRQPTPAPMTDFDLTFDADSIAVEYFYDIFAPTEYSEIEIGITFVPINHNSAMLIICPFLLLTFASSKAKSANQAVTTTYKKMVSLRRLTARSVNVLVSLHSVCALQSTPYSQRHQP